MFIRVGTVELYFSNIMMNMYIKIEAIRLAKPWSCLLALSLKVEFWVAIDKNSLPSIATPMKLIEGK